MTGVPYKSVTAQWAPRRSGTQDYVHLDPTFPWKPGEIADLQAQIAERSGRPLRRVQYVVNLKHRFDEPYTTWTLRHSFLRGITFNMREYIGHSRCAKRTDWMICNAATEIFAQLQLSWKMRRIAAARRDAMSKRLPPRIVNAVGWNGTRKYRGIYKIVADQFGIYSSYVRDVARGKRSDEKVLKALYQQVAIIDRKAKGVAA